MVSALARELDRILSGARLRAHSFRWGDRRLSLYFRDRTLHWHLHPQEGWLTLGGEESPPEDARSFSARLEEVRAPVDERILRLRLSRPRGPARSWELVVELMTNQWNAFFLEGEDGWIRHLLRTRHLEDRNLAVGRQYRPPPPSERRGAREPLTRTEWEEILTGVAVEERPSHLLRQVALASSLNAPTLAMTTGGFELWRRFRSLEEATPCILEKSGDRQPYPYILEGFDHTTFESFLGAVEAVSGAAFGPTSEGEDLLARARKALERARGKLRGIRREMESAEDPREPRDRGNLLLARLREVPRGAPSVRLEGFDGNPVEVPLDPALSPQDNAQAYFREAARRERARERLPEMLARAREVEEALARTLERVDGGEGNPEELLPFLPEERREKPGRTQDRRLPYRSYRSSGGLEIRVGRGARDNDELTFRHSDPEEIWLHARDTAGAHVILRWSGEGSPPARDLAEAAVLAALGSSARGSGTVPVDWTRRKYVRKPRKAPPGTVALQEARTLFVEPDPELPHRLSSPRPSRP